MPVEEDSSMSDAGTIGLPPSLSQLQARANQLELQRDDLSRNLSSVYSQIIKLKNHDAPISRIPPEVLLAIFHAGRTMSNDPKVPFQVLVSRVIRSWREVALLDPSLWDVIVVLPGHSPSTIQAFLCRSRDRHLTIRLAYSGNEWPRCLIRNMEMLSTYAYRWREFHVEFSDQQLMRRVIRSLGPLQVHRLEKVHIQLVEDHDSEDDSEERFDVEMVVFSGGASRLSQISLTGISPSSFVPFWGTEITKFRLSNTKYEPLFHSIGEFTHFLLGLTSITRLVLEGCIVEGQAQRQVPLSNLRHLIIDGTGSYLSSGTYLLTIIYSMDLPNLESLVIVGGSNRVLRELFMQIGSLTSLKRLELWDTWCSSLTTDVMHCIPSITHLALIRSDAPVALRRLRDATVPIPWPNLRTLTIEIDTVEDDAMSEDGDFAPPPINADDEFTELICGVVVARGLAGAPITKLSLDSDLLCGIPDGRKDWLRGEGVELVDNEFSTFDFEAAMND